MIPLARPVIGAEERAAVDRVLVSGHLAQGAKVAEFEHAFSAVVGGRQCIAVSSGTAALHLALLAAGIGPGDEVIVPSFSFAATANAVELVGARAVFADIDPATFCIDAAHVRSLVGPRTAAVMPVHLYGHPADMNAMRSLCRDRGLLLVEDAAQAHGAELNGVPVGALGDAAAFSFYPTKNMTTGEGGMIVVADDAMARRARLLRNQGMEERYRNEIVGFNQRMTEIAAAIGIVQLTRLAGWNATRQAHAARYDAELKQVTVPPVARGAHHVYHQYTLRSDRRDELQTRLRAAGVESGVYYPVPIHRLPCFDRPGALPHTDTACAEVLSLPVGPHLMPDEVDAVIAAVNG